MSTPSGLEVLKRARAYMRHDRKCNTERIGYLFFGKGGCTCGLDDLEYAIDRIEREAEDEARKRIGVIDRDAGARLTVPECHAIREQWIEQYGTSMHEDGHDYALIRLTHKLLSGRAP